jgi:hypothetical protein
MISHFFKRFLQIERTSKPMYFNHNCKYIERINIDIWNPSKKSIFKEANFEATLHMNKDGIKLRKNFHNNDYNKLLQDVQCFIEKEIKI